MIKPEKETEDSTYAYLRPKDAATLILIDRQGRVRQHGFGHVPDLALGAALGTLLAER